MAQRTNPRIQAIDAAVGGRVRIRRQLLKMSQGDLAEKIGITSQQLQKCEKGINRIGAGRLYQIAQLLGVPLEYFFEDIRARESAAMAKGVHEPAVVADGQDFARQGMKVLRAFSSIRDVKTRRRIAALIEELAQIPAP